MKNQTADKWIELKILKKAVFINFEYRNFAITNSIVSRYNYMKAIQLLKSDKTSTYID